MKKQIAIETKYSRKNILKKVREDIMGGMDKVLKDALYKAEMLIVRYRTKHYSYVSKRQRVAQIKASSADLVMEIVCAIALTDEPTPIQVIATRIAGLLDCADVFEAVRTASELLAVTVDTGLFDIIWYKHEGITTLMVKSCVVLDDKTVKYIENTRYLPPLICKPRPVTDTLMSGYYTKDESVILRNGNHHHEYQAIDALNIANSVAMELDMSVLDEEEKPTSEFNTGTDMRLFLNYIMASREVYNLLLKNGNKFYFNWRFDKRGRMYSQGYEVNIQGTEYKKALINLSHKYKITGK